MNTIYRYSVKYDVFIISVFIEYLFIESVFIAQPRSLSISTVFICQNVCCSIVVWALSQNIEIIPKRAYITVYKKYIPKLREIIDIVVGKHLGVEFKLFQKTFLVSFIKYRNKLWKDVRGLKTDISIKTQHKYVKTTVISLYIEHGICDKENKKPNQVENGVWGWQWNIAVQFWEMVFSPNGS